MNDREQLAQKLQNTDLKTSSALIGFDGFVDEVIHIVDQRKDSEHYNRICYMKDFGNRISKAAGLNMNIEMMPVSHKLGGNGAILANSLLQLEIPVTYIGALGKNMIHPVFQDFEKRANVISISDPGYTDAIEFYDGKIISSKLENLKEINWNTLKDHVSPKEMALLMDKSDILGFENWSLLVNVTGIWKGILEEVIPLMKLSKEKTIFFDLADPAKRTASDILDALDCIIQYQKYFSVILGVNRKEAVQLAKLLGNDDESLGLCQLAEYLRTGMGISAVVVHSIREAGAAGAEGTFLAKGIYCEKPAIQTGAGDHFNAGFLLGMMLKFNLPDSLLLGIANSGFYVRNAYSPTREQLRRFLLDWE